MQLSICTRLGSRTANEPARDNIRFANLPSPLQKADLSPLESGREDEQPDRTIGESRADLGRRAPHDDPLPKLCVPHPCSYLGRIQHERALPGNGSPSGGPRGDITATATLPFVNYGHCAHGTRNASTEDMTHILHPVQGRRYGA